MNYFSQKNMKKIFIMGLAMSLLTACTPGPITVQKDDIENLPVIEETTKEIESAPRLEEKDIEVKPSLPELSGEKVQYQDDVLHISFEYPKEWGDILISNEKNSLNQNLSYEMGFSKLGHFLRANDSKFEHDGRGTYWGDESNSIISESDLDTFCSSQYSVYPPQEAPEWFKDNYKECNIITNSNGVKMIRHRSSTYCMAEGCLTATKTNQFHFYNPYSNFHGISLSPARIVIDHDIINLEALEKSFFEMIDSIKFLNN